MRKQNSQYPAAALSRPRQTPLWSRGPVRNPQAVIRTAPTSYSHCSAAPPSIPCAPNTPRALESLLLAPAARIRREGAASAASDGAMTTGTTNAMVAGRSADGSASLPTRSRRSRGAQRGGRRSVGGGKPACVAPAAAPDRRRSTTPPARDRGCDGRRYNRARRGRGERAPSVPPIAREGLSTWDPGPLSGEAATARPLTWCQRQPNCRYGCKQGTMGATPTSIFSGV